MISRPGFGSDEGTMISRSSDSAFISLRSYHFALNRLQTATPFKLTQVLCRTKESEDIRSRYGHSVNLFKNQHFSNDTGHYTKSRNCQQWQRGHRCCCAGWVIRYADYRIYAPKYKRGSDFLVKLFWPITRNSLDLQEKTHKKASIIRHIDEKFILFENIAGLWLIFNR